MYFSKQTIGCNLPPLHFFDFLIKCSCLFHRHFCSEIIWIIKWPRLWLEALCILEGVACVGTGEFSIRTSLAKLWQAQSIWKYLNQIQGVSALLRTCSGSRNWEVLPLKINKYNRKIRLYIILYFTFYILCISRGFAGENGSTGCVFSKVWEHRCEQMLMLRPPVQNSLFDILLVFQER